MPPPYGNFHRPQPVVPCKVKQFGVEPETLDALLLEQDLAALSPERLEPALRIHKRKPQDHAHDRVKHDPRKLPKAGLVDRDKAPVQRPRPDCYIVVLQSLDELRSLLDRRGEVGIRK